MILVTGATGSIGRPLVRELASAGVPFRALVRTEAKGRALDCPFAVGDFDDPAALAAALDGVDRLLLNGPGAVPVANGPQPMVAHQRTVIDLAVAAGVTRIVKVSGSGVRPGGPVANGAHWEIEEHLRAAGPEWAVLRPSGFMQNFRTGAVGFVSDGLLAGPFGEAPCAYVDTRDIAACAAALLTAPEGELGGPGNGRVHDLTGPEALTHREIAARLGVAFRDVPPAETRADMLARGLPAGFVDEMLAAWAEVANGAQARVTDTVEQLTGRRPRTFDAFLADDGA